MQMIRSLASFLLSVTVAQAQGLKTWFGSRKYWPYFAARGFVGAASMTLYYEAIARMPLADAVRHCLVHHSIVMPLKHQGHSSDNGSGIRVQIVSVSCWGCSHTEDFQAMTCMQP